MKSCHPSKRVMGKPYPWCATVMTVLNNDTLLGWQIAKEFNSRAEVAGFTLSSPKAPAADDTATRLLRVRDSAAAVTMGTFSQRLKSMDIYRRIPKDLTEATLAGGSISISTISLGDSSDPPRLSQPAAKALSQ